MDLTPELVRAVELKEGWRGYNRDQVDDFLDRAAATMEALNQEILRLHGEIAQREATIAINSDNEETLKKALLVAQRAADETLASAQARAKAQIAEAEEQALEIIDAERRRTADEMRALVERRDTIADDVVAMEQFEAEYRQRLRAVIEADLVALEKRPKVPHDQPTIHDVAIPTEEELTAIADAAAAAAASKSTAPSPLPHEVATAAPQEPPTGLPVAAEVPPQPEVVLKDALVQADEFEQLGDDEFMASLREAVSDDSPLSPRGDDLGGSGVLFDQDDPAAPRL